LTSERNCIKAYGEAFTVRTTEQVAYSNHQGEDTGMSCGDFRCQQDTDYVNVYSPGSPDGKELPTAVGYTPFFFESVLYLTLYKI